MGVWLENAELCDNLVTYPFSVFWLLHISILTVANVCGDLRSGFFFNWYLSKNYVVLSINEAAFQRDSSM